MKWQEFEKIEIGDILAITSHGLNKGKLGIVRKIRRQGARFDGVYLEPYQCIFEYSSDAILRSKYENGFHYYNHKDINYPKKPTNKIFYVLRMFGENGIKWSADNFTEKELEVIDRFLKEFNEHASGLSIDSVDILDNDEDEEE